MSPSSRFTSPSARALSRFGFGLLVSAATLGAPVVAHADFLDSINPTNWFSGEKYETKAIVDPPPNTLYTRGVTQMRSGISNPPRRPSRRWKRPTPIRNTSGRAWS